jgi:cobalt/nickel transport system permease protein
MHMADALLSPAVGGTLWGATTITIAWCSKRVRERADERSIPLMGVLGAFIFAAQMINFTIPGTGSSGHLGGGLLLAALLGSHAAFLVMASVLAVQALFFADGGLLALGANIFNLGIFPCFLAYPLLYRPIAGKNPTPARIFAASLLAAVVGLQFGALGVVLETVASGVSAIPFRSFVLLMQPIHLAIGLVEGFATAAVISFVHKARPETLEGVAGSDASLRKLIAVFAVLAVVLGGGLSWFASSHPDGLEWAIARVTGSEKLAEPKGGVHEALKNLQEKTAVLPDYALPATAEAKAENAPAQAGPGLPGLVGGFLTLIVAVGLGWVLSRRKVADARGLG